MLFTEPRFLLLFAPLVLCVHWALRGAQARKLWLLLASYVFYAAWDARFLALIWLSTAVDYAVGLGLARRPEGTRRRAWLVASLVVNLGLLATFKYLGFFVDSALDLARALGLSPSPRAFELVLPVGISFYTFQTLSYTIDVYRGRLAAVRSLPDFALFVAFFPQLVAGPIVRAADFLPQLERPRRARDVDVRALLALFLLGFMKKACIADNLAVAVDPVFADPAGHDAAAVRTAALLYASQIYCDFSGYTDMAIASAGLLGYRLPINFALPYSAASLTEFWRRWHVSLSSWLRDYLYIPLGGNRRGASRTPVNLMLTMLLGGLWHGAAWTFLIWGALHGLGLIVARAWSRRGARLPAPLAVVLTFAFVALAWIFFRAPDLGSALAMVRVALLGGATGTASLAPGWTVLALLLVALHPLLRSRSPDLAMPRLPAWAYAILFGAIAGLSIAMLPLTREPFIYFQF